MKQLFKKIISFFKRKQRAEINLEKQNESAVGEDKNVVERKAEISEYDIYSVLSFLYLQGRRCERHEFEGIHITNLSDTIGYLLHESLVEEVNEVYYQITDRGLAKYNNLHLELTGNVR